METYFAQLDRTCSRLRALDEHVSQTEDFVNIDLVRGCRGALLLRGCTADVADWRAGFEAQHADRDHDGHCVRIVCHLDIHHRDGALWCGLHR